MIKTLSVSCFVWCFTCRFNGLIYFVKSPFMVPFLALHSVFRGLRRKGFFSFAKKRLLCFFSAKHVRGLSWIYKIIVLVLFSDVHSQILFSCSIFNYASVVSLKSNPKFSIFKILERIWHVSGRMRGRCYTADDGVFAVFIKICYLWKKTPDIWCKYIYVLWQCTIVCF